MATNVRPKARSPKITLDTTQFKRSKLRNTQERGYFFRIETSITFISKVVIALFMAPVLVITSIISKATLLICTNIVVAVCTLFNHLYKCYRGETTLRELFIILIGTAIVAAIILVLTPSISIASPFLYWLFIAHILASAVNGFDLIKDLVVSIFKTIYEKVFGTSPLKVFAKKKLSLDYLDPEGRQVDIYAINLILQKHYGIESKKEDKDTDTDKETQERREIEEEKIKVEKLKQINKILKKLCKYINKKSSLFMGFAIYQSEIERLKGIINDLIKGDASGAIDEIKKRLSFKTTKIQLLENKLAEIKKIQEQSKTAAVNFSESNFKIFKGLSFSAKSVLDSNKADQKKLDKCIKLLSAEIERQKVKKAKLEKRIPIKVNPTP
ncbi:MAG: hypothetical protein KBD64_04595 [Gammaproteobacteria bacterium]|nr:hypothetical protein [Gammaproteobacteria bacterium]